MKPLTMEAFLELDPEGERAAILAGLAPEGIPNPYEDEPTDIDTVLSTIHDVVLDQLPDGRLATAVSAALEEAIEAFDEGDEPLDVTYKSDGRLVSIETKTEGPEKSFELIFDGGDEEAWAFVVKRFRKPQSRSEAIELLFGALAGRGVNVEMIGMMG